MRVGGSVKEVVDGNYLHRLRMPFLNGSQHLPPNAAKAIDADLANHAFLLVLIDDDNVLSTAHLPFNSTTINESHPPVVLLSVTSPWGEPTARKHSPWISTLHFQSSQELTWC